MTKTKKRLLASLLALAMTVAMAAPTFAAETRAIESPVGNSIRMHGYGSFSAGALTAGVNATGVPITLRNFTGSRNQKWLVSASGANEGILQSVFVSPTNVPMVLTLDTSPVSNGIYPVVLSPSNVAGGRQRLHFSNYDGRTFRAWLESNSGINTYNGYRLYIDKSDTSSLESDIYFLSGTFTEAITRPNTFWVWGFMS